MSEFGNCRHCAAPLTLEFADLGATPVSNDYLDDSQVKGGETFYPLRAFVCQTCRLVQLQDFVASEDMFRDDYAYFSSFSNTWLAHAEDYATRMTDRFNLGADAKVVEIASNDGYLLQYFKGVGIPVLGIEPCKSVADAAITDKDVPTEVLFFGVETAKRLATEGHSADLMPANNVLAHVPDINDFVGGFRELLKLEGVATFEFPHLLQQITHNQFDTIYHEHFSYLSLLAVERILKVNGMRVFDTENLTTHGGSLRVFACRVDASYAETETLAATRAAEADFGLDDDKVYSDFADQVRQTKHSLLSLLMDLKGKGKRIVGYGAPAKGNTLLNFCGIGRDILDFTVDRSPHKQDRYLPGTRLPIHAPEAIFEAKPDYVLILPWNLKDEIKDQMAGISDWGGQFVVPIPEAKVL
ncbi:class I SAM-dependent methyltransferase [Parasedimentitalea maritima]|uniref:Class I SAM-dependent methyltransferase n=1 Tax=Parasedimentitalea maritima TaxID=2578117 RepID=A0ABY2URW4_9RHOB|nr:class I SAM-dependent methyltransferase [Zongyanglinia marina]TLP60297.1 class I SAM-dependent methyltransferase [Zongyanglinia marina]